MGMGASSRIVGRLGVGIGAALLLTATPAAAQFGGGCSRADLQAVADGYIAAQTNGEVGRIPMGLWVQYTEQLDPSASMAGGMLSHPEKIDFSRSLLDTTNCATFTEVVITDPAHPYVLGTMITARGGSANAIDTLVTDAGDWLFNAANTLKYAKAEDWSEIPEGQRDSRDTIVAAANAYLDSFDDKSVQVPWGTPCARLEGGLYTGKGAADDSCNVGVPSGVKLINRRYVVDENLGAVAVVLNFGEKQRPDAHIFRIEHGKIRYVHTITVCADQPNCGFPQQPPAQAAPAGK